MKRKSTWILGLVSAGLLGGCTSNPPVAETKIVPFAKIRDAADSADGYYVLGRELQRSGKFDDAERAYKLALEKDPTHIDARNGLAAVSVNRGELDLALSILSSLAASHPDQPHLLANLGHAHYLKGNYFDARIALEEAVRLDPANQRTREKLKAVLNKLGVPGPQEPEAVAEAQQAIAPQVQSDRSEIVQLSSGVYQLKPAATSVVPQPELAVSAPAETGVPAPAAPAPMPTAVKVVDLAPPPASPVAVQPPVAAATGVTRSAGVEIINGNGVAGLARSLRSLVQASEWQVLRVANHPKFNVQMTRIEYAPGNRDAAQELARDLQVTPVYRHNDALGGRVRVVLGYDLRSVESLRERILTGRLALLAD